MQFKQALLYIQPAILIIVSGYSLWAQQPKRSIPREDYKRWYTLSSTSFSDNGEWIGYTKYYDEQEDTLVIQDTYLKRRYSFAAASLGGFISSKAVMINSGDHSLHVDLETGKTIILPNKAKLVDAMPTGWYAIYYKGLGKLIITSTTSAENLTIDGLIAYEYAPTARSFLITRQVDGSQLLELILLDRLQEVVPIQDLKGYKLMETTWQDNGERLAYTLVPKTEDSDPVVFGRLAVYTLKTGQKKWLPQKLDSAEFKGYQLKQEWQNPLHLASDGTKVAFSYRRKPLLESDEIPEIWHSTDPYLVAGMRYRMGGANLNRVALWDLSTNEITAVTNDRFTEVVFDPGLNYAVVYDPSSYRPSVLQEPPIDLYLKNLKTGSTQLLETSYTGHKLDIAFSHQGRYLAYPSKGKVNIYDLSVRQDEMPGLCIAPDQNDLGTSELVAWYLNEESVLLQGKFDLWKLNLKTQELKALTQGRTSGIVHKLIKPNREWMPEKDDPLFLEMSRDYAQGYTVINPGKEPKLITFGADYVKWPKISPDSKTLIYLSEAYNRPKALEVFHLGASKPQRIFQSNPQYRDYELPRQELIHYTNAQGDSLQGILRYPTGYNENKHYPMVVYVYEKQSQTFNHYTNPGFNTTIGFNPANMVNRGYFVLQPDIAYKPGETAFSATDCILAGTHKALQQVQSIDPQRLGLIGHSFGGFETGFTVTQTDLFTTAISGAGIYDNPSFYLFVQDHTSPAYYQYEEGQLRMPKNLFNDYQGYLENSALYHARDMNTPLLLWSGREDHHVDFNQTIDFYMGLKRLQKSVTMLLYPGMGHSANKPEDQKDLSLKVEHWFDHYLKGIPAEDWMR